MEEFGKKIVNKGKNTFKMIFVWWVIKFPSIMTLHVFIYVFIYFCLLPWDHLPSVRR